MNTIQHQDDELRQMFQRLTVDTPSTDFSNRVMRQVMLEAVHAEKRQHTYNVLLYGMMTILIIMLIIGGIYVTHEYYPIDGLQDTINQVAISVKSAFATTAEIFTQFTVNTAILLAGAMMLLLLLGDLLIRCNMERKKTMHCM